MNKKIIIFLVLLLMISILIINIRTYTTNKFEKKYLFADVELLFKDQSLTGICLAPVPPIRKNRRKYFFIFEGSGYHVVQNFWGTHLVGYESGADVGNITNAFLHELDVMNSKGVVGICIPADSTIQINIENFDTNQVLNIDSTKLYEHYKYICITKSNIKESFYQKEYSSNLFILDKWYFYYSNL